MVWDFEGRIANGFGVICEDSTWVMVDLREEVRVMLRLCWCCG